MSKLATDTVERKILLLRTFLLIWAVFEIIASNFAPDKPNLKICILQSSLWRSARSEFIYHREWWICCIRMQGPSLFYIGPLPKVTLEFLFSRNTVESCFTQKNVQFTLALYKRMWPDATEIRLFIWVETLIFKAMMENTFQLQKNTFWFAGCLCVFEREVTLLYLKVTDDACSKETNLVIITNQSI